MSRRRKTSPTPLTSPPEAAPASPTPPADPAPPPDRGGRLRVGLVVVLLLSAHYAVALDSLRRENPTIDEIAHLPAGLTYWQKRTFKLYHHNPPLSKLVASLPVLLAGPETASLYDLPSWTGDPPSQAAFGHSFAMVNASRYFELFTAARMAMPLFSVLGGLAVFAWSARLYGPLGGLLSLGLWCLCPNILAHARLVTSDVAGAAMAVGSTFLFWLYLRRPTWGRAALAGLALGLAELTKFSLLLLYAYWPLLWLARRLIGRDREGGLRRVGRELAQGLAIVVLSVLVIDLGYGFEGVGRPLGSYRFTCRTLTRPRPAPIGPQGPLGPNWIVELANRHRENRFKGTILDRVPAPLPYHFLAGFDDQKIESEGIPDRWVNPNAPEGKTSGYPVYLDGELRGTGWWYYYLACLAYKVPEGTWILLGLSGVALFAARRTRAAWSDEFAVLAYPAFVLFAMSALTDINLGLRYVLPVFPFLFVGAGKVVPWASTLGPRWRKVIGGVTLGALGLTSVHDALLHPSYLASFNRLAGGPDRGSEHLIDSNLDWGQDLVTLRRWVQANRPGATIGLAYFGQINPSLFNVRGEEFSWFLPPVLPGLIEPTGKGPNPSLIGPAPRLKPGTYAASASLVRGLKWRVYDSGNPLRAWSPAWNAIEGAFSYFADLAPVAKVGHSIFVYDLTQADCDRINPRFEASRGR